MLNRLYVFTHLAMKRITKTGHASSHAYSFPEYPEASGRSAFPEPPKASGRRAFIPFSSFSFSFSLFFLLLSSSLFAQSQLPWLEKMHDPQASFSQIKKKANKFYKPMLKEEAREKRKAVRKAKSHGLNVDSVLQVMRANEREHPGFELYKRWEYVTSKRLAPDGSLTPPTSPIEELLKMQGTPLDGAQPGSIIFGNPANTPGGGGAGSGGGTGGGSIMSIGGTWTSLGPVGAAAGGGAGRINSVRINPLNPNSMWACAPDGGLWRSTNGGASWTTNTDQLTIIGVSDVVINPLDTNIMYLATGDGPGYFTGGGTHPYSIGVLKSTNGGATWATTSLTWASTLSRAIYKMVIDPTDPNVVMIASTAGIWRTANAGANWTQTAVGQFSDIEFKPTNHNILYATTIFYGGFFRSVNNGAAFTQVTSGLPAAASTAHFRFAVGVTPADTNYVYVLACNNTDYGFSSLFRSTDGGTTFTTRSSNTGANNVMGWYDGTDAGGQGYYTLALACSPTNKDTIYVGGVDVWRSGDGGATFTLNAHWYGGFSKPYVHADIHALEFGANASTLYVGCDGGVFKTTNSGTAYSDISTGLCIAQQYCLGTSATNANMDICGHQDNGGNLRNGSAWTEVTGGDGTDCMIDFTNANIQYSSYVQGEFYKTTNLWSTQSTIVNSAGTGVNSPGDWVTPILMNPRKNTTLLVGKDKVYKSINGGTAWTASGAIAGVSGTSPILHMAYAPSDTSFIYVSNETLLFKSINNNSTYTNILGTIPATISVPITFIAVSNTDKLKVWVTLGGYNAPNKVFATVDGGTTWTNISTGLPNFPVNCIVYEPNSATDAVYAGTDIGVYYRNNTMTSWQLFNNGMPNTSVFDMEVQASTSKLRAATFGRGLWESDLYSLPVLAAGFKGAPDTICLNKSVTFTDTSVGAVTSWAWNFGAGATPATANTVGPHTVTYSTIGAKTVSLTVNGTSTATYNNYIQVMGAGANNLATTYTWTGNVSTDWFDACNWNPISVPGLLSDVIIPGGTPNQPLITGTAGDCKTITIVTTNGAVLTVNSGLNIAN